MQMRARNFLFVEFDQHALAHGLIEKKLIFALGAVAPENIFWFRQSSDFMHPIEDCLVGRRRISDSIWREDGGRNVFHRNENVLLTTSRREPITGSPEMPFVFLRVNSCLPVAGCLLAAEGACLCCSCRNFRASTNLACVFRTPAVYFFHVRSDYLR